MTTRRTCLWWVLVFLSLGCGGSLGQEGAYGVEVGPVVEAHVDAEESIKAPDEDAGFPETEAMADAADARLIASGTRYCNSSEDCLGLVCDFGPTPFRGACVVHCARDAECEPHQRCFGTARFAQSCFATCNSPAECAFGFDCVDYLRDGAYTCLPTQWVVGQAD
jgi:hypothetical protein